MKIEPVTLEGDSVRLEPLSLEHLDALCEVGLEESIWRWTLSQCETPDDLRRYIEDALNDLHRGVSLPFVTVEKSTGVVVGSTRFGNIDVKNRKAEIGWTWINPRWQRTRINSEAKLLMLTHAFETWRCIRVELKTDALNARSRTAIARIGAKEEGTLRSHMITDSGRYRDSVYFSIIESEWPKVKEGLNDKLQARV
jgi:RimJ/RimL family protein N-acetyltransferase